MELDHRTRACHLTKHLVRGEIELSALHVQQKDGRVTDALIVGGDDLQEVRLCRTQHADLRRHVVALGNRPNDDASRLQLEACGTWS